MFLPDCNVTSKIQDWKYGPPILVAGLWGFVGAFNGTYSGTYWVYRNGQVSRAT